MIPLITTLAGAGAGAALMYFLDPQRGTQRRAQLRDKATQSSRQLQDFSDTGATNSRHRLRSFRAALQSRFQSNEPVSDDVLIERVRAVIGRAVSNPSAIDVTANNGRVTLSGPVLAQELPLLLDRVLGARGVRDLDNRLQRHAEPGNIPSLQGANGKNRSASRFAHLQSEWTPSVRIAAGVVGGAAALYGFAGRGAASKITGIAGAILLTRAATNLDMGRLTGLGKRHSIRVQKSIRISAPIEQVFGIWADSTNFPQFMTHVRDVRPLDAGEARRWHWKVRGTSGMEFEFDTQMTAFQPNQFLSWRTEPGALIQHEGQVRFTPNDDRSTTAQIQLAYTPIAGAVGHVIAKLLGDDPKTQMNDDLMRMKSFIETGARPRDAAARPSGATLSAGPGMPLSS